MADPFSSRTDRKLYELSYPDGIGAFSPTTRVAWPISPTHAASMCCRSIRPNLSGVISTPDDAVPVTAAKSAALDAVLDLNHGPSSLSMRGRRIADAARTVIARRTRQMRATTRSLRRTLPRSRVVVKARWAIEASAHVRVRDNESTFAKSTRATLTATCISDLSVLARLAPPVTQDLKIQSGWDTTQQLSQARDAAPLPSSIPFATPKSS